VSWKLRGQVPRQEFVLTVDRMIRDALKDMSKVELRIQIVEFGRAEQAGIWTGENSRITGQNAFEAISRKPHLARVRDALYYFSAGILMPSGPLGRA
jgi:hypothetical protein